MLCGSAVIMGCLVTCRNPGFRDVENNTVQCSSDSALLSPAAALLCHRHSGCRSEAAPLLHSSPKTIFPLSVTIRWLFSNPWLLPHLSILSLKGEVMKPM